MGFQWAGCFKQIVIMVTVTVKVMDMVTVTVMVKESSRRLKITTCFDRN